MLSRSRVEAMSHSRGRSAVGCRGMGARLPAFLSFKVALQPFSGAASALGPRCGVPLMEPGYRVRPLKAPRHWRSRQCAIQSFSWKSASSRLWHLVPASGSVRLLNCSRKIMWHSFDCRFRGIELRKRRIFEPSQHTPKPPCLKNRDIEPASSREWYR
jgi:hypothetical protein